MAGKASPSDAGSWNHPCLGFAFAYPLSVVVLHQEHGPGAVWYPLVCPPPAEIFFLFASSRPNGQYSRPVRLFVRPLAWPGSM